ncbi:MAG: hypothetical protein NC913_02420 [Candidatus Omnitrophica bacterium]|nr:hypothetical protein [Candidatus Omnitrophota bacterium]
MTCDGLKVLDIPDISESETKILAEEILKTFDFFEFVVVKPGQILAWFPGNYPYVNWNYPFQLINLNFRECLPKGGSFRTLVRIISNSFRLLDKHPVNKVRVDLGENPANFLWFHSQNKNVERICPITEKTKKKAIYWSNSAILNDLASYIGFEISQNIPIDTDNSIIWINITTQGVELINLMRACEFIDKEILKHIGDHDDRLVIEFNDGFYNKRNALYFIYPKEKINFLRKFQLIKKTPGCFLLTENG